MILTAARQDPAQSSSVILTTVTDGVVLQPFLAIATALAQMPGDPCAGGGATFAVMAAPHVAQHRIRSAEPRRGGPGRGPMR